MSHRTCSVDGCKKPPFSRGYCADHRKQYSGNATSSSSSSSSSSKPKSSLFDSTTIGVDDMILLSSASEKSITDNLQLRFQHDLIYTYIGHVLISVNPFKQLGIYSSSYIKKYAHKSAHENPAHIYSTAEDTYRTMMNEEENQCVIISGESGAGKTEAAKSVMNYIASVSGGGSGADSIKTALLQSNPLLEALGNAKTLRNNNSSRFGKYFSINCTLSGTPCSGLITNYLLEKSRVCFQTKEERNFHIFYQIVCGAEEKQKEKWMIDQAKGPEQFTYLSACTKIIDVDDTTEFTKTRHAMKVTGFGTKEQEAIFELIVAILHLGNVKFKDSEKDDVPCKVSSLSTVCTLLGMESDALKRILLIRHIETARESYDIPNNYNQCIAIRDAIAKNVYMRLFDYVVRRINESIRNEDEVSAYSIGILDIYGFEVFNLNGFDQFNINFVNEKLQQIFIDLTLKAEQEEYEREGIQWQPIVFFNNKIVCELIEGSLLPSVRLPPGIFSLLDDINATMHSESGNTDKALTSKVLSVHGAHPHLREGSTRHNGPGFIIQHFAGPVEYSARDFAEKNSDALSNDTLLTIQTTTKKLLKALFPEEVDTTSKKKSQTNGSKIRIQTKELVAHLMSSNPHYIRTIKSNDNKQSNSFDTSRVLFQVKYLGLLENLRVRRAGFAYRREFHEFAKRFALLSKKTWPNDKTGSDKEACKAILTSIKKVRPDLVTSSQVQLGRTMIFVKDAETLDSIDGLKLTFLGKMVSKFQRLWRRWKETKEVVEMRKQLTLFLYRGGKDRRRESFYRPFTGLYLREDWQKDPELSELLWKHENSERMIVVFADEIQLVTSNIVHPMHHLREKFPALFTHQQLLPMETNGLQSNWVVENSILMFITKENIFFIQKVIQSSPLSPNGAATSSSPSSSSTSASAASALYLPRYFLRRLIPLPSLASLSLTHYADTYLSLHMHPDTLTQVKRTPQWKPDASVAACEECGERFGLFLRRKHCRGCGGIFCWACTQRTVLLPDYGYELCGKEAVKICSFCFGKEYSSDFMQDLVIKAERKTEIMFVLQDLFKKSPLKLLPVTFTDTFNLTVREHTPLVPTPTFQTRTITFKRSNKSTSSSSNSSATASATDITATSSTTATILSPAGLAPDFIKERQKRAEKRRAKAEVRREEERVERQRRTEERDAEREAERKARLAEKKRAKKKAAAAAAAEAEEAAAATASSASSTALVVKKRSKSSVPAAAEVVAVPSCTTCGCEKFVANAFKPGKCNACFHVHQ